MSCRIRNVARPHATLRRPRNPLPLPEVRPASEVTDPGGWYEESSMTKRGVFTAAPGFCFTAMAAVAGVSSAVRSLPVTERRGSESRCPGTHGILRLLYYTGLRVSPICGIRIGDLSIQPVTMGDGLAWPGSIRTVG